MGLIYLKEQKFYDRVTINKGYKPTQNTLNPVAISHGNAQSAKGSYAGAGGSLLVDPNGNITPKSFAAWVKAGMPGPREEAQRAEAPMNLNGVTCHNIPTLVIDRNNFYTFLGFPSVPPDLETAQRAAAAQLRALNARSLSDPNLAAQKQALRRAQGIAEKNLRPAAEGGGLITVSRLTQYLEELRGSLRGYVQEMSEMHYHAIGSNVNATKAGLEHAYRAKLAEINKRPAAGSFKDYGDGIRLEIRNLKAAIAAEPNRDKRNTMKLNLQHLVGTDSYPCYSGERRKVDQDRTDLNRSWQWIKKRHGI
jgi:hypothetical protein